MRAGRGVASAPDGNERGAGQSVSPPRRPSSFQGSQSLVLRRLRIPNKHGLVRAFVTVWKLPVDGNGEPLQCDSLVSLSRGL